MHDWNVRLIEGIPPFQPKAGESEIDIQWLHRAEDGSPDLAASIGAAKGICEKANEVSLKKAPALESRHSEGKAIDWYFSWSASRLLIKCKSGDPMVITTTPHNQTNKDLISVAQTYGVIHLIAEGDPPHFISDGS